MGREKVSGTWLKCRSLGSPPRRRGKEEPSLEAKRIGRITPAWAGKSSWTKAISTRTLDHPRVGGEKISMSSTVFFWQGSPPHGRGKDAEFVVTVAGGGITPAWAGKSRTSTGSCHFWEDHPRMGGEKPVAMHSLTTKAGSPPRGRGKVAGAACRDLLGGITPAWAGKRRCTAACNGLCWDHPRVGGEKIDSLPHRALYLGSPPRGRGKAHLWIIHQIFIRITPAWAGKRLPHPQRHQAAQDHPRVGGEKV